MGLEHKPHVIFDQSFAPSLQLGMLRLVTMGWNEAHRWVRSRFDRYAAHDLLGHERRAYVEHNLHAFAKRHRLAHSEPRLNRSRNAFHVELVAGKTILTASSVASPDEMVRDALFRNTLARDAQTHLFERDVAPPPSAPLYGILLYGPPSKDADQRFPGFVTVAFPDHECRHYVGQPIDLMSKFRSEYGQLVLRLRRNEGVA